MATAGSFACDKGGCVVNMKDIAFTGGIVWTNCSYVSGTVSNVTPKPCYG